MLMEAAAWPGPSGLREAAEREEGSTPRPPLRERPTARCGCGARFLSLHGWWVHSSSRPEPGPGSRLLRDIRFLTGRSAGRAAPRPSRPSRGGRTVRHTEPRPWGQGGAGPDTARPPGAGGGRSARRVASCTRRPQGAGGHSGRRGRRPPRAGRCRSLPRCMSLSRCVLRHQGSQSPGAGASAGGPPTAAHSTGPGGDMLFRPAGQSPGRGAASPGACGANDSVPDSEEAPRGPAPPPRVRPAPRAGDTDGAGAARPLCRRLPCAHPTPHGTGTLRTWFTHASRSTSYAPHTPHRVSHAHAHHTLHAHASRSTSSTTHSASHSTHTRTLHIIHRTHHTHRTLHTLHTLHSRDILTHARHSRSLQTDLAQWQGLSGGS